MNENQNNDPFKLTGDQPERLRRNVAMNQSSRRRLGGIAAASERMLSQLDALTPAPDPRSLEEQLQEDLRQRQQQDHESE